VASAEASRSAQRRRRVSIAGPPGPQAQRARRRAMKHRRDGEDAEDLLRRLAPRVLGAVVRRYGHFDTAEDAVQEALLAAALQWPTEGVPENLLFMCCHPALAPAAQIALTLRAVGGLTTAEIARAF